MKKFLIIAVMIFCFLFSSCDLNFSSVDSLMRPPKLSGDSSLLQDAFEKSVNNSKSIIMKTPMSGDNRSSYFFYNLDNDGKDEAFVLYSDPAIEDVAYLSVFKKVDNDWTCVSNIKGRGKEIYEVSFADINGDSINELIVSWTSILESDISLSSDFGTSNGRIMTIYSYDGSSLTMIKSESFTKAFVEDINGDNADELFVLNIDMANQTKNTSARIVSFNSSYEVVFEKEFPLTGMFDVFNIVTDNYIIDDSVHTRIYVDGIISENGVVTEVVDIAHDNFDITLPLYESNISEIPLTLRDVRTASTDIDNDGIVEIPTLETLASGVSISGDSTEEKPLNLTVWSELSENGVKVDFKCLLNSTYGYMFNFSAEAIENISVVYNLDTTTLTFYSLDSDKMLNEELFALRAFSNLKWEENDYDYIKIAETDTYVYCCKIYKNEYYNEIYEFVVQNLVI